MPAKPTVPDLAEKVMREDEAILRALAGGEASGETQIEVARDVMRRRRGALRRLSRG